MICKLACSCTITWGAIPRPSIRKRALIKEVRFRIDDWYEFGRRRAEAPRQGGGPVDIRYGGHCQSNLKVRIESRIEIE